MSLLRRSWARLKGTGQHQPRGPGKLLLGTVKHLRQYGCCSDHCRWVSSFFPWVMSSTPIRESLLKARVRAPGAVLLWVCAFSKDLPLSRGSKESPSPRRTCDCPIDNVMSPADNKGLVPLQLLLVISDLRQHRRLLPMLRNTHI